MGCDIHLAVEHRDREGRWRLIERLQTCEHCHGAKVLDGKSCGWCDGRGMRHKPFYDERHYSVFAILANVRNGIGFAGVDTGDGFEPISEPRGLPDDMDSPTDRWLSHEHSASWLLLSEVIATDDYWNRTTKRRGVVSAEEFVRAMSRPDGRPQSWAGDVSGGMVRKVSVDEMRRLVNEGTVAVELERTYTRIQWTVTYREECESFLRAIDEIRRIDYQRPKNVRLVFDFDS